MKNIFLLFVITVFQVALLSCHSDTSSEGSTSGEIVTPVTVTNPAKETLTDSTMVNAVSAFLLKTNVKANANGYIQKVNVSLGDFVNTGEAFFEIKTKEATSLGNTINSLDSSFHFKCNIIIRAPGSGYITALDHQAGDYVQEGDQVASISDASSFVFLLRLPYELTPFISQNNSLRLILPDGIILNRKIVKAMPTADASSQTQNYAIKVNSDRMIPENIIAKIVLIKKRKTDAITLSKEAVLTNETQSEFWVMKLINDSTAVKIPVKKGMETLQRVEILSPSLNENDQILLSGNYGLADTAKVSVIVKK